MLTAIGSANAAAGKCRRTERYELHFWRLEQLHEQLTMRSVMRFYALLEAERAFIEQWAVREDATCQDMLKRTETLFQLKCVC